MKHPEAGEPVVEIERLTVRYGPTTAVDGVTLEVAAGTVFALLGRNGAGKTSLVRCLLGHRRPQAGGARLFGADVWRHRASLLSRVGVVPEQPDMPPAMTAAGLGRFCARLYPSWDAAFYAERLRRLAVPADLPCGRLSRGQKGQLSLSLALAVRPALLVLDDPTLGLDPVARRSILDELIDELAERHTTVFLTTHGLADIEGLADRVAILTEGRLLLDEPLELLRQRVRRIELRQPAAAVDDRWLDGLRPLAIERHEWGVEAVVAEFDEARLAQLEPALDAGAVVVSGLTLEEIFVSLAGEGKREVQS